MPVIKTIPKMHVAFVTNIGPFGQAVPNGFGTLFSWLAANHFQPMGVSLAIYPEDPEKVPPEKIRSESCVVISKEVVGSGPVAVKEIGGFQAATMEYRGAENIMPAYSELYSWLHAQGYRDNGDPIETYISQPGQELHAEIAVPIVKAEMPKVVSRKKPTKAAKGTAKKSAKRIPRAKGRPKR